MGKSFQAHSLPTHDELEALVAGTRCDVCGDLPTVAHLGGVSGENRSGVRCGCGYEVAVLVEIRTHLPTSIDTMIRDRREAKHGNC